MSGHEEKPKQSRAKRLPSTDYDVGYGKPPSHSQFKPGRSGNPEGRRKGSKTKARSTDFPGEQMKSIVMHEAYRLVSINDPSGPATITMMQAIVRSMAVNAAKGNQRSQRQFTALVGEIECEEKRIRDDFRQSLINYKVDCEAELKRQKALGITGVPEPLPHPDQIDIDFQTGDVRITGPITDKQKAERDKLRTNKQEIETTIAELEELIKAKLSRGDRQVVLDDLKHTRRLRDVLLNIILEP